MVPIHYLKMSALIYLVPRGTNNHYPFMLYQSFYCALFVLYLNALNIFSVYYIIVAGLNVRY